MVINDGWPSRLKERVLIEQPVRVVDEFGGGSVTWSTVATVWAEVLPINQFREREQSAQLNASASYRIRLRKRSDINATMRVTWNAHVLLIHSIHEHEHILELLTYAEAQ